MIAKLGRGAEEAEFREPMHGPAKVLRSSSECSTSVLVFVAHLPLSVCVQKKPYASLWPEAFRGPSVSICFPCFE